MNDFTEWEKELNTVTDDELRAMGFEPPGYKGPTHVGKFPIWEG